ncbi:DUF605-domain-containing protein [Gymnopus androsaceus JB14]|uniref:DUF605-domain-containing protein n=1 Tax=Gymnopus androsaceus JB14 TaxID=1447944 RepID=A0A6A4HK51_9AGAR|nr:DUF605-domain-containing protein [Gymnopus androsaceus JB14]
MTSLGLPPVPPPLKSLSPYLQRADELHQKEPIIAYWCAYYAAQAGISLKAKDAASRTLLMDLLDALEKLKKEIGPNDAIDIESASAAYVENFALKVFSVADEEDRRGNSSRSTAKKFLAAANFLEVLKTFPKTELTESTEDKIRYSKWKAADIAKAFREGRKPTPGGVGEEPSQADLVLPVVPVEPTINLPSSSSSPTTTSHSRLSPPAIKRSSPPPVLDELPPQQPFTPPRTFLSADPDSLEPISPGKWSTAATPGAGTVQGTPTDESPPRSALVNTWSPESPTPGTKPRRGSQSSTGSADSLGSGGSKKRKTSISPRRVHFFPPDTEIVHPPPEPNVPPFVPPSLPSLPPTSFMQASQLPPPLPPPISYMAAAPIIPQEVELTPAVVAKAQKHCRFAISALDYEDAEQARRELRAALAILGG